MGNQRRVAGVSISVGIIVLESMIPQLSPYIGAPIVLLCILAFTVSLAPERVREMAHSTKWLRPTTPHVDKAIDWIVGVDLRDKEKIPAFEALQMYTEVRPNSYETSAINLADSTRLGKVRAWGRPRPKMAIPDHMTAVEPIPPDVWAYAVIDANLIHGPTPQSNMKYRQQFVRPYIEDDRTLYDAVHFNKKEVVELCRAVST